MVDKQLKQSLYEHLIETRIKVGNFQHLQLYALAAVQIENSIMQVQTGLIMPIIANEWNLTLTQQSLQFTLQLLFMAFGYLFMLFLSRLIQRKVALCIGVIGIFICSTSSALLNDYVSYLWLRSLAGFFYGINSSIIFIICNELYFKGERSNYFTFLGYAIPAGEFIGVLFGYIFLDSLGSGDWRLMELVSSITSAILALILIWFYIKESPYFLLQSQQYEQGIEILNFIGKKNDENYQDLTEEEIANLQEYMRIWELLLYLQFFSFKFPHIEDQIKEQKNEDNTKIFQEYISNTLVMLFARLSLLFIYVVMLYMLPIILYLELGDANKNLAYAVMFLSALAAIPGNYLAQILLKNVDIKRAHILQVAFILIVGFSLLFYITSVDMYYMLIFLLKMSYQVALITLYVLLSVLYENLIRVQAYYFNYGISAFISIAYPTLQFQSFYYGNNGPYLYSGIFIFFSIFSLFFLEENQEINFNLIKEQSKDKSFEKFQKFDNQNLNQEQLDEVHTQLISKTQTPVSVFKYNQFDVENDPTNKSDLSNLIITESFHQTYQNQSQSLQESDKSQLSVNKYARDD